jgi:sugar lactone lactonase YvrE
LQKIWEANGFSTPESVLPVPEKGILYVSNIGVQGSAESEKTGFISVLNHDGSIQELKWVTGLKAPKGMAISGDRLYVTQVNSIAEIDIASGHLLRTFDVEGAQFLNDIVADASGALYISDSKTGTVHRLKDGAITTFIKSSDFTFPNDWPWKGITYSWSRATGGQQ